MKLFEHPDFEQAVIRAAEHFRPRGLREAIIEKDYFVTEALRIIEQEAGSKVIFKGGTSLSKGWNLIQRFSEDIDIFLDPTAFDPPLGKKAIDRELKKLRQSIGQHPGLKFVEKESLTIGGFGRNDRFEYVQRFGGTGDIRNRVFVEAGTASGREPTDRVRLQSFGGQKGDRVDLRSVGAQIYPVPFSASTSRAAVAGHRGGNAMAVARRWQRGGSGPGQASNRGHSSLRASV